MSTERASHARSRTPTTWRREARAGGDGTSVAFHERDTLGVERYLTPHARSTRLPMHLTSLATADTHVAQRWRLVEIAELSACPALVRDGVTDYLQHVIDRTNPYAPVVPVLRDVLARQTDAARDESHIVDLGSGGGGPWRALSRELGDRVRVTLTDALPNAAAFRSLERESGGRIVGDPCPMQADAVPHDLPGVRTFFSAFHHLPPTAAVGVLRRTVGAGHSIAIFEATRRDPIAILLTLLTPLMVLLMTPAIRPFRWSRLVFTYLIPIIPLVVLFDGVVSCLRTYTPDELLALGGVAAPSGVTWRAGLLPGGPVPVTYLVGIPDK